MVSQSDIQNSLKKIWGMFSIAGVTDPLTIIENLAYFFLREEFHLGDLHEIRSSRRQLLETQKHTRGGFVPSDLVTDLCIKVPNLKEISEINQLVPQFSNSLGINGFLEIGDAAHTLLQEGPSAAEIFNEILPDFLDKMEPGGRYFTPRHLTRWAASLLDFAPGIHLADFACGSGGFLVARPYKNSEVTGVELSPNWARLAFTNCLLHGITKPDIRVGNSLSIFGKQEKSSLFDRILMNPPFGSKVDDSLVNMAFDFKLSGRSETVLTALACEHLKESGQLVVFLPSSSLFASSSGEQILRSGWVENDELAAVVQLPVDAFQPYSQVITNAIVIDRTNPHKEATWFFIPRYDGYTTGRNRQEDPDHNDLPLITAVLQSKDNHEPESDEQLIDEPIVAQTMWKEERKLGFEFFSRNNDPILVEKLDKKFPNQEIDYMVGNQSDEKINCLLLDSDGKRHGLNVMNETEIPVLPTPINLNENIRFEFAEVWDFYIEVTPDGGKYKDLLDPKKNETFTFLEKVDFQNHTGLLIYPDGSPCTPAFKLPRAFENKELGYYNWLEDVVHTGILLTIPPINEAKVFVLEKNESTKYLISIGDQSMLGINIDRENGLTFEVYESMKINLGKKSPSGMVIDTEGSLIGLRIPASEIQSRNYDCQPSTYFPGGKEVADDLIKSPAEILADIQNSQYLLSNQIGKLLSLAEIKTTTRQLPPEAIRISPIGSLHGIQKAVWDAIEIMVEKSGNKQIPKHFKINEIQAYLDGKIQEKYLKKTGIEWDEETGIEPYVWDDMEEYKNEGTFVEEIQHTLDLLERMGVVVRVSINGVTCYRLISESEINTGNKP